MRKVQGERGSLSLIHIWFNTFVYAEVGPFPQIVNAMVAVSAIATTFATFFFGTLSDRAGKRKPFISIGYIIWGIFTIAFGLTGLLTKFTMNIWALATVIVLADTVMSFFGSMGNDAGFNAWTADLISDDNKGAIEMCIRDRHMHPLLIFYRYIHVTL